MDIRRAAALLLALVMIAALTVGCGKKQSDTPTDTPAAGADGRTPAQQPAKLVCYNSALTVTAADGKSLSLTASEGVWLRSGQDVTQWSGTLTEALGQLTLLRCIDYRPSTGVAELCGLTEPAVTLTVTYRAIAGETELTLRVGAQRDGGYYATVNDDDTIYLLPAAPAEALAALAANGLNG